MRLSERLRAALRRAAPRAGGYIPALETVRAAERAGLSVEAHVERLWDQQGFTARVVDRMAAAGALAATDCVLEIGAGTGRYLARVQATVKPRRYESYETAADWAAWLATTYGAVDMRPDGETLAGTPDRSAGLVHAHGVFVYLPFLVATRYLDEIARVAGRWVVFDFCSTAEFDDRTLAAWWATEHRYPVILDRGWILARLAGFAVRDEWTAPYGAGSSRYLALEREGAR